MPAQPEPSDAAGRSAAAAARERLGLGVEAVADPFALLEEQGLAVVRRPMGKDGPDGIHGRDGELALVAVNSDRSLGRQRFTVAHAYGHHLLHGDQPVTIDRDVLAATGRREREANAFASHFLMPADGVARQLRRLGYAPPGPHPLAADDVVRVAHRFGVSYDAALGHLLNLGLIDRSCLDGLRAARPEQRALRLGLPPEPTPAGSFVLPADYVRRSLTAYERGLISTARLAELLRTTEPEAEALARGAGAVPPDTSLEELLDDARRA